MNNDWLTAHSFQQMEQVLSAINVVSLQIKLTLLGMGSPIEPEEYRKSQLLLREFTQSVQKLLEEAKERGDLVILGANPRMRQFASQFLTEQSIVMKGRSSYDFPLDDLQNLLTEESETQQKQLLLLLDSLRSLVEQHVYEDANNILGEG